MSRQGRDRLIELDFVNIPDLSSSFSFYNWFGICPKICNGSGSGRTTQRTFKNKFNKDKKRFQ